MFKGVPLLSQSFENFLSVFKGSPTAESRRHRRSFRGRLRSVIESLQAQIFVSLVILGNAGVIGVETDHIQARA